MEATSEEYLRGINYDDKDKTDDYRVFSIPLTENMAYRRLEELSKENDSHVRKVLDQYIWDAPNVIYEMSLDYKETESIGFIFHKLVKVKCMDYKYQAYEYQAENGEIWTILYDDVLYKYNEDYKFLSRCAISCDIFKKQLKEFRHDNGEKLTGKWEETENRIKYTTKKLNNYGNRH